MATTTRGSKPSKTPVSPGMNDAIALMREKTEQDLVEMKASQEKLQSAHGEIAASVIEIKATQQELAAAVKAITGQLTNAVELFKQGHSAVATGSNNNGGEDKKGLEEKETTGAATPARLNLKYIYGMGSSHLLTNAAAQASCTTTHTSSANEGGSGMSAADRLRQRLALGQTQGSVGEITTRVDEPIEVPAASGGVREVLLSLTKLPVDQRRVLSGKLREILNDTSIDRDERARVASALIRRWFHEDQSDAEGGHEEEPRTAQEKEIKGIREEVQVTDIEELLDCEGSGVSEVVSSGLSEGVDSDEDIGDGTQNMEVLAPLEEQQEQEFATGIIAAIGIMEKDVMQSGDSQVGGAIRDDSIVSIMSMGYEGCCFQEESMEAQRQGHGVIDYDYDYGVPSAVSNGAGRHSCQVKLDCLWSPEGLLGYYLEAELGLDHPYEHLLRQFYWQYG